MATTVRITETYDMKTSVNKMGIVGIHTPSVDLLRKLYPGLLKNHRFVRFVKCDVVGACASVLPADPLQVGVESGNVAPEDMFNPILYTAVTNSSFDTLIARIQGLTDVTTLASVGEGDLLNPNAVNAENMFKAYYALLSENGKYRKAMPQAGFSIKGIVPLCHTILSTFGNVAPQGNTQAYAPDENEDMTEISVPSMEIPELNTNWETSADHAVFLRGKAVKMPKFPIHFAGSGTYAGEAVDTIPFPNIPKTNVLALVLPPARLHEFWYRMRVTWTVRFENVISTLEAGNYQTYLSVGGSAHGQNYTVPSAKLNDSKDMVDVTDVEINKVMES